MKLFLKDYQNILIMNTNQNYIFVLMLILSEKNLTMQFIIKEKIILESKKYTEKVKVFRELFDLDNENFSYEQYLKVLKENDFDYELTFFFVLIVEAL